MQERALQYFKEGKYNCCQAVICAYCDEYGINVDDIFKMTEGFGAGMGGLQDTCGAVTGLFMTIGLHNSAGDQCNPRKTKMDTYKSIREYAECFKMIHGSIYCRDLKSAKNGRQAVSCDECVKTAAALLEKYIEMHQ